MNLICRLIMDELKNLNQSTAIQTVQFSTSEHKLFFVVVFFSFELPPAHEGEWLKAEVAFHCVQWCAMHQWQFTTKLLFTSETLFMCINTKYLEISWVMNTCKMKKWTLFTIYIVYTFHLWLNAFTKTLGFLSHSAHKQRPLLFCGVLWAQTCCNSPWCHR